MYAGDRVPVYGQEVDILDPASPEYNVLLSPKFTETVSAYFTEIKKNLESVINTPEKETDSKMVYSCPTEREGFHAISNSPETCIDESEDCFSKQDFESSDDDNSVCADNQLEIYQGIPSFGIES